VPLRLYFLDRTGNKHYNSAMHFDSQFVQILMLIVAGVVAIVLLIIGHRVGHWNASRSHRKALAEKENELFTAQKGFKSLYEREAESLKNENQNLKSQIENLNKRVEDYRKKAAGFGGLFNSGNKRADAMYALLLENEALEEALYAQNEKLRQERTDALAEQMRATGYRRVLMSQLLSDDRIKGYVAEMIETQRLPNPQLPSDQK
jgi:predicted RNase H-like nuclease (RuvC/YqgF family)